MNKVYYLEDDGFVKIKLGKIRKFFPWIIITTENIEMNWLKITMKCKKGFSCNEINEKRIDKIMNN